MWASMLRYMQSLPKQQFRKQSILMHFLHFIHNIS